ncbi:MAG: 4Fe-4S binding protein [Armatimonadota bacterium]|nr:4Fe-4S binding protein [Armatimonadota bacterium]
MGEATRRGMTRRDFLARPGRGIGVLVLGGGLGLLSTRGGGEGQRVWQIDPEKCTQCGRCATACVLNPSAVKCVHIFRICGYCELCFGFFEAQPASLDTGAENQRCPTGALERRFIEDPYYEYHVNEALCIGCGKCVEGCTTFGNGSLQLQVNHALCVNCNQCAIALVCPSQAFVRLPANRPYLLKHQGLEP